MKRSIFILIIILSFLISCSDNSTGPQISEFIIPLAVGNVWTYNAQSFNENGEIIGEGEFSLSLVRENLISNEQWYQLGFHEQSGYHEGGLWTNRDNGLWIIEDLNDSPVLLFKYPASIAEYWFIGGNDRIEVISTNEKVSVNGINYDCYHYRIYVGQYILTDIFVSPGIGIVLVEEYKKLQSDEYYLLLKESLKSYSLK